MYIYICIYVCICIYAYVYIYIYIYIILDPHAVQSMGGGTKVSCGTINGGRLKAHAVQSRVGGILDLIFQARHHAVQSMGDGGTYL